MPPRIPPLTVPQILKWADEHKRRTGRCPCTRHGRVPEKNGIKWETVNDALRRGQRGLPGGITLWRLLKKHRGAQYYNRRRDDLDIDEIRRWALEHHRRTGLWPQSNMTKVAPSQDVAWTTVDAMLAKGGDHLPGGDSLTNFIRREFGLWSARGNMPLTIPLILKWADEHKKRAGKWPIVMSGRVPGRPETETWAAINEALKWGRRGLPGGSSVAKLLTEHRGASYKPTVARLSEPQIVAWAKAHHRKTGSWPTAKSGRCEPARMSWALIDRALRRGEQGLRGGSSLSKALRKVRTRSQPSARVKRKPTLPPRRQQRASRRPPKARYAINRVGLDLPWLRT